MGDKPKERYYVDAGGGRGGWPKTFVICDRSTVPHKTVSTHRDGVEVYKIKSRPSATKLCAQLNAEAGTDWKLTPNERDSLTRLRDWAARSKAFTEREYDPTAAPALVVEAA